MKERIKETIAWIVYMLYRLVVKRESIKVHSVDETLDVLLNSEKSMVRFGDSDIVIIRGKKSHFQISSPELIRDLKRIIGYQYEDLIVTIPNIFGDLNIYRKESQHFWRDHLLFFRKTYETYCNRNKEYYNTSISRFYLTLADHSQCGRWVEKIKTIWKDKDIVIVEGENTHNGVGNDLLDGANSIERIIGPGRDAYAKIEDIYAECIKYPTNRLFLISLGSAAKPLTERLFLAGYRVIDIGNLDMEYEWYLRKSTEKEMLEKHSVVGKEANEKAGYCQYLDQIVARII